MSSACVCHIENEWCFYCEMYVPMERAYKAEKERADKAEQQIESLEREWRRTKYQLYESKEREQKLRESLNKVYFDDFLTPQGRRDYIDRVVLSLYPKEEEAK